MSEKSSIFAADLEMLHAHAPSFPSYAVLAHR